MNERIEKLVQMTLSGEMFPTPTKTEYDREDIFLSKTEMESKRICEYIENQTPVLNEFCTLTGLLSFDGSCVGDAFNVAGHREAGKVMDEFYLKQIDNISVMEWQHATGDYHKVLERGISGITDDIEKSLKIHSDPEERDFLIATKKVCQSIIKWAHKCSQEALKLSESTQNPQYRKNLQKLSKALLNVPEKGAESFYEAVLCICLCYSFNPDSFGTLDRYLQKFYDRDIQNGVITRSDAKEILQEFLLVPQARNTPGIHSTKGGQSHFCVGGYTTDKEDGFTDLSKLIIESLMELPTYIPEVSFRWTPKTSREDFRFVLDCERNDKFKRIAFTNDEKRMKGLVEFCSIPFEKAINYTLVGCNELAFPGAISASTSKGNILRCIDTLFHKKSEIIENAPTFEDFYEIFEKELFSDLDIIYDYDDKYNLCRSRDINYVSSIFFNDCIENAKSMTQGGTDVAVSSPMLLGMVNLIDSIIAIRQFVYEEKLITMKELINALKANWKGYDHLRMMIEKKGEFFGNDTDLSNDTSRRIYESIHRYLKGKRTVFGYPIVIGDHTGYNEHFKWFGEKTKATPDTRFDGDVLSFGLSQRGGKDREGLTSLLSSIAKADSHGISCGSTVSNITVEESLVRNDDNFEKLVDMLTSYFKCGGMHFQLNYVSKGDLIKAKKIPDEHKNLRVRVTGFSEYFVKLKESIQDDIIERTSHKC